MATAPDATAGGTATAPPPRVQVVTTLADLWAIEDEWHDLLLRSPGATAFASPAWVLTWYRHFERSGGLYAVVVRRGRELVGLAPFARSGVGGRRVGFQLLVSAGTEHGDHGEPLLGPDPAPVAAAIADHLAHLVRTTGTVVNLRRLRDGGVMAQALEGRDDITLQPMGQVAHNLVLDFTALDDPAGYLDRLARQNDVTRRMRRLRETCDTVTYSAETDDVDGLLDVMKDMLQRRWGPGGGPRLFAAPGLEAFTRSVLHALVDAGLAYFDRLSADGRTIAVATMFRVGDHYVGDNAAYDPELGRYGLGQAVLYEAFRQALSAGAVDVDLRAGDFPYKQKWANDERLTRSLVVAAPGRRGEVMLAARRAAMSLRARHLRRLEQQPPGRQPTP